jgi:hypothetical protein
LLPSSSGRISRAEKDSDYMGKRTGAERGPTGAVVPKSEESILLIVKSAIKKFQTSFVPFLPLQAIL